MRQRLHIARGLLHGGKEMPRSTSPRQSRARRPRPTEPFRKERDLFYVDLFDVALGTGLRRSELMALRFGDVDRAHRLIRVERAYSLREVRRPKTDAGVRSVPLFASVDAAGACQVG